MNRPCLDCGKLTPDTRCADCQRPRNNSSKRGYGAAHQRARQALALSLPAPCGYGCGTTLTPTGRWVAAHRVDGHAEYGYVASCVPCNERAKRRPLA